MNIFRNYFYTDLKYVLLQGKRFHPRCDRYMLNINYCCPLTGGRVCHKEDTTICRVARAPCENVFQSQVVCWHCFNILTAHSSWHIQDSPANVTNYTSIRSFSSIFKITAWNKNFLDANHSVLVRTNLHTISTLLQWACETNLLQC